MRLPFKIIWRIFQLVFALVLVFLISFFVTLALRTPEPEVPADENFTASTNSEVSLAIKRQMIFIFVEKSFC